jgi:hypothetical protein
MSKLKMAPQVRSASMVTLPLMSRTVGRVARVWRGMPQISAPIATAVSAIRFEKPHSLSYHDRTRAMRPSITLV